MTFVRCCRMVKCCVLVTYRCSCTPGRCSVQLNTSVLSTDSNWGCGVSWNKVAAGGLATVWGCGINFCQVKSCPQIWPSLSLGSFLELRWVSRQKSPKMPEWFSRPEQDSFFFISKPRFTTATTNKSGWIASVSESLTWEVPYSKSVLCF